MDNENEKVLETIDSLLMLQPVLTVIPEVVDKTTDEHLIAIVRD